MCSTSGTGQGLDRLKFVILKIEQIGEEDINESAIQGGKK